MQPLLASLLRRLRRSRAMAQWQAAQAAGLTRTTINRWETGSQKPRARELETLLEVLGASPEERRQALSLLNTSQARTRMRFDVVRAAEQRGMAPMPHGGELLRALRVRRGFSQEEAARQIGVSERTVRRWERSEVWPSTTQLHTLCYVLGAHTEEVLALTTGQLSPSTEIETILPLEEVKARGRRMHFYARGWEADALKDLFYLTMEAQAWPQIARSGRGWQILAELYSYHSAHLARFNHYAESSAYANRALDLLPPHKNPTKSQVMAGIHLARGVAQRGTPSAIQRALDSLHDWRGEARWPAYKAWLLADMALYSAQLGDRESSLNLSKESMVLAAQCSNRHELYCREIDQAQLLLYLGDPQKALAIAQKSRVRPCVDQTARFLLIESEAYFDLNKPTGAQDLFQQALTTIETWKLPRVESFARRLAQRLGRVDAFSNLTPASTEG